MNCANFPKRANGTTFSPSKEKVGNEELESWLLRLLTPKIHFRFFEFEMDGASIVLLEVGRAFRHPVQFKGIEFIRVGSYKKRLKEFAEKERALWRIFDQTPFEKLVAAGEVATEDVLRLLDYSAYFDLLKIPLSEARDGILQWAKQLFTACGTREHLFRILWNLPNSHGKR